MRPLSAKLEKRFSNGLQFLTAYTWSHALANSGTPLSGSGDLGYSGSDQLGFGIFQRFVGYPAQLHQRVQLRSAVRQRQAIGRQHESRGRRDRGQLARQRHRDSSYRRGLHSSLQRLPGRLGRMPAGCRLRDEPQRRSGGRPRRQTSGSTSTNVAVPAALTGGNLGLQSQTGPPHPYAGFLGVQGFHDSRNAGRCSSARNRSISSIRRSSTLRTTTCRTPSHWAATATSARSPAQRPATERHIQFSLRLVVLRV